jgi:outer membrane lipoprotein-sorting protein
MKIKLLALISVLTLSAMTAFTLKPEAEQADAKTVVNGMLAAIDKVNTLTFELYGKERFGTKYVEKRNFFKVSHNPVKVYIKDLEEGIEVLYAKGWNGDKCYINTNGFPYVNVSMGPLSARVREGQHHSLFEAGFKYVAIGMRSTIKMVETEKRKFDEHFKVLGEVTFDGKACYNLNMINTEWAYSDYKVTKDETPRSIAMRLNLNEQIVMDKNNLGIGVIKAGKVIKIPNSYAQKVVFYVDKKTMLPICQFVYDENGLYEKYEYTKLVLNPKFAENEFTDEFKGYGF